MSSKNDYLAKYLESTPAQPNSDYVEKKSKKKTKKKKTGVKDHTKGTTVRVIDHDEDSQPWNKFSTEKLQGFLSVENETPQIVDYEEVCRVEREKKLMDNLNKRRKDYYETKEDGSGWIKVDESGDDSIGKPKNNMVERDSNGDEEYGQKMIGAGISTERRVYSQQADEDMSPVRRQRHDSDEDMSPVRRQRHDSDDDASPIRRQRHDSDEDASPVRRPKHDSDEDASPVRRPRHDSDEDASPPRRPTSDLADADETSANRLISKSSQGHAAPDEDLSPERKQSSADGPRGRGMARGRKIAPAKPISGLRKASELKEEIALKKKADAERIKAMGDTMSGRNADTVLRDAKTGKRLGKAEEVARRRLEREAEEAEEEKMEWGQGLVQKREAEVRRKELADIAARPFARSRDDRELESILKSRVRFGDPMAHLVKRDQVDIDSSILDETELPDVGVQGSGFKVPMEVPAHSWMKRGALAPTNRYGIKPGRHWDGVNRSNGFEEKLFRIMNERESRNKEARFMSTQDM